MATTISLPQGPNHPVGPGAPLSLGVDHAQTPGSQVFYEVKAELAANPGAFFWIEDFLFSSTPQTVYLGAGTVIPVPSPLAYPVEQSGLLLVVELHVGGSVTDTSTASCVWAGSNYLGELVRRRTGGGSASVHTIDDVWNSVNREFPPQ